MEQRAESNKLERITLRGFKTIKALEDFAPGPLTVLIGPNGAGKTNFISFFCMLGWMMQSPGGLQRYIAQQGGANALLYNGAATTHEIEADLTITTRSGENHYVFRLVFAAGDTLIFAEERWRFSRASLGTQAPWKEALVPGRLESGLPDRAEHSEGMTSKVIAELLQKIVVHQFHNTSSTARIRSKWNVTDNRRLKEDAANIAPILYRLKEREPACYRRIVENIRLILPFFADFALEPDNGTLLLSWREVGNDILFDASQASDGMLRVMALVTLLLQPERDVPDVLIIDEPELGLHPYAINVIGGLIGSIAIKKQVIVATQSVSLLNCFEAEEVVVVDRENGASMFNRLNGEELQEWLEDYSLSELWEKNVIGGRP